LTTADKTENFYDVFFHILKSNYKANALS